MPRRKGIGPGLRFLILQRDKFRCQYCGVGSENTQIVVDHIVALANGGKDDSTNMVSACQPCNGGKASRALSFVPMAVEARKEIVIPPKKHKRVSTHVRLEPETEAEIKRRVSEPGKRQTVAQFIRNAIEDKLRAREAPGASE